MRHFRHTALLLWLLVLAPHEATAAAAAAAAGGSPLVADSAPEPDGQCCKPKVDSLSDNLCLIQTSSKKLLEWKLSAEAPAALDRLRTAHAEGSGGRSTIELAVVLLVPLSIFVLLAAVYYLGRRRGLTKGLLSLACSASDEKDDSESDRSILGTMALGMAQWRRTVIRTWFIVALLGFGGACGLPNALSNSMAPSPGMASHRANARFQSVFPVQARASAFVCVLKAEPPAKILDVKHLGNFTLALRDELNSTGHLLDFTSNASFWFESGVVAEDMFVSPDGSAMIMEWTARDDYDTMAASKFASWSRRVVKKRVGQLEGISFHGLVSVADLFNFVMSDLANIVKTSIVIVVPAVCLVLWGMLGSWRMLLVPVVTFTCSTGVSCGILFLWGRVHFIHACTPSVVSCMLVAFAMDFSLFILTRFRDEVRRLEDSGCIELDVPQQVERATVKAMETSGRTVLTSTVLLLAPLLALTCFPVMAVSSMGVGASVSLCSVLVANLSLAPAVLATFPHFFHAGASRGSTPMVPEDQSLADSSHNGYERKDSPRSQNGYERNYSPRWVWTATLVTSWPWNVVFVLIAVALAVYAGFAARLLVGVNSLAAFIPRGSESHQAFLQLRDAFGLGTAVPFKVMLEPQQGESVLSRGFWEQAQLVVNAVATEFPRSTLMFPNYARGLPVPWLIMQGCALANAGGEVCRLQQMLLERFSNSGRTAMWGYVRTDFDPMTHQGVKFTQDLRHLAATWEQKTGIRVTVVGNAADSADVVSKILDLFPTVALVDLAIVLALCGIIFRSALIPVWQSLTIGMTLLYAYGLATITYQEGGLEWTGLPSLSGSLGAVPWMCIVTAFPFVVGLCLDYDIFLLVRVNEFRAQGLAPVDAIRHGVCSTGNIITAAGVIMGGTFASLLFSSIPFINIGAFIMVVAVLFDTFFIRTLVVPAAMSLAGRFQWWPSELSQDPDSAAPTKQPPAPPSDPPLSDAGSFSPQSSSWALRAAPPSPSVDTRKPDPSLRSRRWSKPAPKEEGSGEPAVARLRFQSEHSTTSTGTAGEEPQPRVEAEQSSPPRTEVRIARAPAHPPARPPARAPARVSARAPVRVPSVEEEEAAASTSNLEVRQSIADAAEAQPQSQGAERSADDVKQSTAVASGEQLQSQGPERSAEDVGGAELPQFLRASDAHDLEAVSQVAVTRLMEYAEEVQMGNWGEPVGGSKETGLVYMHGIDGCSTTAFVGVLTLEDVAHHTLARIMEATTPSALARYLDNASQPSVYKEVHSFGPRATLLASHSHRRCLLIELTRASLDLYCEYGAPQHDRSGAECHVMAFVGTSGYVAQEALAAASAVDLKERLAELARAEAGPDPILSENHITGFVIRRDGNNDTLRLSCILQLDPVVSYAPRTGLDYAQFQMVQDGLRGVLKEIGQEGV